MNVLKTNFLKNLSLSELGLVLLIPLASFTSHTWLPVPPTMVLFLGAAVCWVLLQMENGKWKIENGKLKNIIIVFSVFASYIFASQYLMGTGVRHYIGAMFAPLYLVLILIFSERASDDFLKNLGQKFIRYSLVIFSVEAVLRYAYSFYSVLTCPGTTSVVFYDFKFAGPMYYSSNAVATHLVTLLFFMFWWGNTYKQSMKKEICVALVLIALALSRASILAIAVGLFYYAFFRNSDWKKSLITLFSIGTLGVLALLVLRNFFFDYSFQSKFLILEESLKFYYQTASLRDILFGIGILESTNIMTHHAHNHFLLYLMEMGVIGLILLCATLFVLVKVTNGKAMIVLVPFLVHAMAESNTFLPYLYVIMALMITTIFRQKNE